MVVLVTVAMLGLLGRVVQLQIVPPQPIAELVNSQHSRIHLQARRGNVYDRVGRPLAVTRVAWRLFVDPLLIEDHNTFSEMVGYRLGYDPAAIEQAISARIDKRFVVLEQRLSEKRHRLAEQLELSGLATQPYLVRDYPLGSVAAAVIGFVGRDRHGLEGMEASLDTHLAGQAGTLQYRRDARGEALWVRQQTYRPDSDGGSISLTIDATIQSIAETELSAACRRFDAKVGMLVAMEPRTGQILAMANYPTYDLNHFKDADADRRRNRCVTDAFEPGSVFKPFVWAAAIEAGVTHPGEVFNAHSGFYVTPKGRRLRDAHGYDRLTCEQAMIKSSNIVMAIIGQRLDASTMFDAVGAFGFGRVANSGLPGEAPGLVHPLKNWTHYSVTSIPMGQEIGVTALQMVRAFSVFANDGMLVSPIVQLPALSGDGGPVRVYESVLSARTATLTRSVLRKVVTDGTGRKANSPLYSLWGKTGTAQIASPDGRGYLSDQYVASFIAGAPYEEPKLIVGCFIHRPDPAKEYYGGRVSAPVVRNVMEQGLAYLGVEPEDPDRQVELSILAEGN